jgi:hypothetical protein
MAAATYAADEIKHVRDGLVNYYSDEEGNFLLSYMDPVVIGRSLFHSTDEFITELLGSFRDQLCAVFDTILDMILDIRKGTIDISFIDPVVIGRRVFNAADDMVGAVVGYVQGVLCAILDTVLSVTTGTTDITFIDPVVVGRSGFKTANDFVNGIVSYIQDVLCSIMDPILGVEKGVQDALGFYPMGVLHRVIEIITEQVNMIVDYFSDLLFDEDELTVEHDPMKVITDAVVEMTDKKEVLGYMSGMLISDQDEAAAPSADLNLVRKEGEFLPPIEKRRTMQALNVSLSSHH